MKPCTTRFIENLVMMWWWRIIQWKSSNLGMNFSKPDVCDTTRMRVQSCACACLWECVSLRGNFSASSHPALRRQSSLWVHVSFAIRPMQTRPSGTWTLWGQSVFRQREAAAPRLPGGGLENKMFSAPPIDGCMTASIFANKEKKWLKKKCIKSQLQLTINASLAHTVLQSRGGRNRSCANDCRKTCFFSSFF